MLPISLSPAREELKLESSPGPSSASPTPIQQAPEFSPVFRLAQDMKFGAVPFAKAGVLRDLSTLDAMAELQRLSQSTADWPQGRWAAVSFSRTSSTDGESAESVRERSLGRFSAEANSIYQSLGLLEPHHCEALVADNIQLIRTLLSALNPLGADFSIRLSRTCPGSDEVLWHYDDRTNRGVDSGGRIGRFIAQYVGPGPWHAEIPPDLMERENSLLPLMHVVSRNMERVPQLLHRTFGVQLKVPSSLTMTPSLSPDYLYRGKFPVLEVQEGEVSYHLSRQRGHPGGIHTVAPASKPTLRLQLFGNIRFSVK